MTHDHDKLRALAQEPTPPEMCPACHATPKRFALGNWVFDCGNLWHPRGGWLGTSCANAYTTAVTLRAQLAALRTAYEGLELTHHLFVEQQGYATAALAATAPAHRAHETAGEAWPTLISQHLEWAAKTFPHETQTGVVVHLQREVMELADNQTPEELVDCLLLVFSVARHMRIDLLAEARRKFAINQTRQWGAPDAEGVAEHVRRSAAPAGAAGRGEGA